MLTNISWVSFWITMGWLLTGWYLLLAFYYAKDLKALLLHRFSWVTIQEHQANKNEKKPTDPFELAQYLRGEIGETFQLAAHWRNPKEEIVMALQILLRRYPSLKGTAFQVAINHFISQEGEKQCSISFSEEELTILWRE